MFKLLLILAIQLHVTLSWKYQTKCTRHMSAFNHNTEASEYNSIIEDFERDLFYENDQGPRANKLRLKCANVNDFLFIGQTKYGVSSMPTLADECTASANDCLVTVDYIANQCNGLNSCDIVLDAQFLHSCKNNSDYISIAYECIPGSQKIDICSNDETFIIDSSFAKHKNSNSLSKFGSFYLTSPDYPIEYKNDVNNCSCKLEYVKIDSNYESSNIDTETQMNLVFNSYEFDLEESFSEVCQKDYFRIKSDKSDVSMCGQHKRFKETYSTGSKLSLEFKSDDVITRRGFLIKVSTQSETYCPFGSVRFSSTKCIKLFGNNEQNSYRLDWFEASKSCESLNGRLASIRDFVDDLKLESFLVEGIKYWSRKYNESKCYTKTANGWSEGSCMQKNAFICEFDPVNTKQREKLIAGLSDNSGNRLIRVACGASSTIFSSSFKSVSSSSTKKSLNSNSITNTQKPSTQTIRTTNKSSPTKSLKSIITIDENNYQEITSTYKIALKNDNSEKLAIFSQDLILIIAIACGVSIVLVAINIFCLWNYLSRKLKKYYNTKNDIDQQTYRSSSISRSNKSTNRTLTSSVDSYAKVPPFDLEHMSACESLSSSGSELVYSSNKPTQHYYETLNKQNNQWNSYAEYNPINRITPFDSMVVMPCAPINSHYMTTVRPVPINPTVVLLKQLTQLQAQQQTIKLNDQEQYSCVVYGELSPASSNGSNQPLITFSSSSSGVSAI